MLSEGFWRNRFGGDAAVIGRQIRLDGMPFTVVGVVPQAAQLIGAASVWALIQLRRDIGGIPGGPSPERLRGPRVFRVVGRMKPGVSLEAADSRHEDGRGGSGEASFRRRTKGGASSSSRCTTCSSAAISA